MRNQGPHYSSDNIADEAVGRRVGDRLSPPSAPGWRRGAQLSLLSLQFSQRQRESCFVLFLIEFYSSYISFGCAVQWLDVHAVREGTPDSPACVRTAIATTLTVFPTLSPESLQLFRSCQGARPRPFAFSTQPPRRQFALCVRTLSFSLFVSFVPQIPHVSEIVRHLSSSV